MLTAGMMDPPGPFSSPAFAVKPVIFFDGRTTSWAASASFRAADILSALPFFTGVGLGRAIFQPDDAFVSVLVRQAESSADLVLGLFPVRQSQKADMVDLDVDGHIR